MSLNTLLASSKLTAAVPSVENLRDNPGEFPGLSRVPFVPAEDGDITARVSSRITAGDIYPDGAPAVVKPGPTMTLVPVEIANFKRAVALKPAELSLLARIVYGGGTGGANVGDLDTFGGYIRMIVRQNRMGNLQRMENAVWGMMLDAYTYSANGTIFTVNWGKPSNLKVTPATPWATSASATPVTDIANLIQVAADQYGVRYDRITMGTADFVKLVGTAQFQAMASVYSAVTFGSANAGFPPASNTGVMIALAGRVLGVDVELYDATMPTISNAGTVSVATRHLPANKVVLSRKADDGNEATWDFANGTVLESINAMVSDPNGGSNLVGGFGGVPVRGPVSFAFSRPDLSGTEIHDVCRGFPRTHNTAATAVLTVG